MKIISQTQVGVLYTCNCSAKPVLAKDGSVHHYEHVFTCADEYALISNFAKVCTKYNTLCMDIDLGEPLVTVGDTVSVTFERRVKHYDSQPAKVWWAPICYTSYTRQDNP